MQLSKRVARLRPRRSAEHTAVLARDDSGDQFGPEHPAALADGRAGDDSEVGSSEVDVTVSGRRAGMYIVSDAAGREVARIRGDYVVGFTLEHGGRTQSFGDLEEARRAVAADGGQVSDPA